MERVELIRVLAEIEHAEVLEGLETDRLERIFDGWFSQKTPLEKCFSASPDSVTDPCNV